MRPRTLDELRLAHGIGPHKAERHGAHWLAIVAGGRKDGHRVDRPHPATRQRAGLKGPQHPHPQPAYSTWGPGAVPRRGKRQRRPRSDGGRRAKLGTRPSARATSSKIE